MNRDLEMLARRPGHARIRTVDRVGLASWVLGPLFFVFRLGTGVSLLALGVVGGVGVGAVAARAQEAKKVVGEEAGEEREEEEAKGDGGSGRASGRDDGHGDGAREPEDCGDAFEHEGDEAVEAAREEDGDQGNVDEDEDGPDGVEEHEGDGRGSVAPPVAGGDVDQVGSQAKLNDEEHGQNGVDNGEKSEGHGGRVVCVALCWLLKWAFKMCCRAADGDGSRSELES
jgi:hypothetical protein